MVKTESSTNGNSGCSKAHESNPKPPQYMPDELWRSIIEVCDSFDRAALASTSHRLRRLTNEPRYWRSNGARTDAQADSERQEWHAATRCLSQFGRHNFRNAFAAARAADIPRLIDCLSNVDCDAAISGGSAPRTESVWKSILSSLGAAAILHAQNGDQAKLIEVKKTYAIAARYGQADECSDFFQDLERTCDRARVKQMLDAARRLALVGDREATYQKIREIETVGAEARPKAEDLLSLKELAHRANFCKMMRYMEDGNDARGSLCDLEKEATLANVTVPSRVYFTVQRKCERVLVTYPGTLGVQKLRDHCVRVLSERYGSAGFRP